MGKSKADVTVHLDEMLARERLTEVCRMLEGTAGVMKAQCAEHKAHLLIVEYDPDAVDSKTILDKVTGKGLHAELIGM
jgi:hypothetical protein